MATVTPPLPVTMPAHTATSSVAQAAKPVQMKRENFPPGDCSATIARPSAASTSHCRWIRPTTHKDFDYIRWYLLHDAATVFVEDDTWYLLVHTPCKHLQHDNRCGIYETRPKICREYSTENCEYDDDYVYDRYFETPEQVEEYVEAVLCPGKGVKSPQP